MLRGFLSLSAGMLALLRGTGGLPLTNRLSLNTHRRFMDPCIGGSNPGLDRRLLAHRFSGFIPSLDPLFMDPRFGQRLLDHRSHEF